MIQKSGINIARIVKSFELVLSLYAQQVPVNTSRTFNESSVVFVAERVGSQINSHNINYALKKLILQRSVQNLVYNGRSSIIGMMIIAI